MHTGELANKDPVVDDVSKGRGISLDLPEQVSVGANEGKPCGLHDGVIVGFIEVEIKGFIVEGMLGSVLG